RTVAGNGLVQVGLYLIGDSAALAATLVMLTGHRRLLGDLRAMVGQKGPAGKRKCSLVVPFRVAISASMPISCAWRNQDGTMEQKFIEVRGAREHNLKNVDMDIPRDKLVVITGLSGSGKSSLAFDTIYAEGQRRYVESL